MTNSPSPDFLNVATNSGTSVSNDYHFGNLKIIPQPQSLTHHEGFFLIPESGAIGISDGSLYSVANEVRSFLPGLTLHSCHPDCANTVSLVLQPGMKRDAYSLLITQDSVRVRAGSVAGAFYAVQTLRQIIAQSKEEKVVALHIEDWPDFEDRGLYYDVSRGRVPKLERLLELALKLSHHKINQLQLYIEHTFLYRGHPDIGVDASPLTAEDIMTLDAFCQKRHIELIPSLASFGHLSSVLKHPRYHSLAEDCSVGCYKAPQVPDHWTQRGWTLSPANPAVYEFLDSLFAEFFPLFSSRRFNACCDETFDLGWGQSFDLCAKHGKGRVYLEHIKKVNALSRKHGKSMMFWGDIIRNYPELVEEIPKDVTVLDWNYSYDHDFDSIREFAAAGLVFYACPGTSSWLGLFPRLPQARANIAGFAAAAKRNGAVGFLNTDWGDGGHYNFMEFSWHGYLFGAEQAWNTEADQPSFTHRFVVNIFGRDDPELANALDEFGEISFHCPSGGGASVWQDMLFAHPDDAIFLEPQPTLSTFIRDGNIVTERLMRDAAFARSLLARLKGIRDIFCDRAESYEFDSMGLLPYWIYAVDSTILAVRKLAAFGDGASGDPKEVQAISKDLALLRLRFRKLWMARNRPSEIGITLKRFDLVIRGVCVRSTLTLAQAGIIRLTVSNTGCKGVSGSLRLDIYPREAGTFLSASEWKFKKLPSGKSRSVELPFRMAADAEKILIKAQPCGVGVHGASLPVYKSHQWLIPTLAQGEDWRKVAELESKSVAFVGKTAGYVRLAHASDALCFSIQVMDNYVRRGKPVWQGSCVEVFGRASETGSLIGQVFLAPPTAESPAEAFYLDRTSVPQIVPAPDILLEASVAEEGCYSLFARIPHALLEIPGEVHEFRLEVVITARASDQGEHQRTALFHAVDDPSTTSDGFGFIRYE